MDAISIARAGLLCPVLKDKYYQMDVILASKSIQNRIVQGLRSWSEQDALFAKGRTVMSDIWCHHKGEAQPRKPGTCPVHPKGAVVTNCPGGHSWHNFGLAFDLAPDDPTIDGYQPDWNVTHDTWKTMEEVGKSLGLEVGAYWRTFPDNPHFQLNGRFPVGSPDDEVRQLFKDGGVQAVWDELNLT